MKRALGLFAGMFTAGVLLDRARLARKAHRATKEMVPDYVGNYDLDGVSYDAGHKKVVVSSDARAHKPHSTHGVHQIECAEKLTDQTA
jgi:hypothetical protein